MGLVLKLSWGELRRMPTREIRKNTLLELPSIGWQLFILDSSQSDSIAFPSCLDTYATRLLTEPLNVGAVQKDGKCCGLYLIFYSLIIVREVYELCYEGKTRMFRERR